MDPLTTAIVAALSAGIASGTTEAGKSAVLDAYKGLKQMIQKKFGKDNEIVKAVDNLEKKPDSQGRVTVLEEEVELSDAHKDSELLQAARHLMEMVKPHQAAVGKNVFQAEKMEGFNVAETIGSITQTFGDTRERK